MTPREEYRFGPFHLDAAERELRRDDEVVALTAKTLDLLLILVRGAGRTFTKSQLLEALWPDTVVEESNLTQTVFILRKVLGDEGNTSGHILTVPRRGYKFMTPVTPIHSGTEEPPSSGNAPPQELARSPGERNAGRRSWRIPLWTIAVSVAVVVAGSSVLWYAKSSRARVGQIRSIAVLPLRNLTGSPDQDYLAGGMTEVLTTSVGQIAALTVIAASSARHYEGSGITATQIARELNVDALVEGAVQRSGNRMLITTRLIDGPSQRQLWAKSFERDVQDVLGLQNEVASALAQELRVTVTPAEQARLATRRRVLPEAQEAYIRALDWGFRRADWLKAREYLLQATQIDPNYAAAWAQLGDVYGVLSLIGLAPQKETYPMWRAAVTRALELDDTLAAAHGSLAGLLFYHDWNWRDAEKEFQVAIAMDPNSAMAHSYYSNLLLCTGRLDHALEEAKKSVRLNPLSGGNNLDVAGALLALRRYDEAIAAARESIELGTRLAAEQKSPIMAQFLISIGHQTIGQAEEEKGNFSKAIAEFQQLGARKMNLAHAYALAGRRKEALQMVAALDPAKIPGMQMAEFYAAIGDKDKAFEWLEKGYDERPSFLSGIKANTRMDPLRSDPRYAELLRRMGLPQ